MCKMLIVEQGLGHNMREKMATTGTDALLSALEALHGKSMGVFGRRSLGCAEPEGCKQNSPLPSVMASAGKY